MKRTLTLTFALLLLLAPAQLFAMGGFGSLTGDEKTIATALKDALRISEEDAFRIFTEHFRTYLEAEKWHTTYYQNDTIESSAQDGMAKSDTRVFFLDMTTDNRFVNIAVVRYGGLKVCSVHVLETLPRKTATVMDKYNELKGDSNFKSLEDNDIFATYAKTGYTDRVSTLGTSPAGAIQYRDFYTFKLNQ